MRTRGDDGIVAPMSVPATFELELPAIPEHLEVFFEDPAVPGGFANPWGTNIQPEFSRLLRWQTQRNPWRARKKAGADAPRLTRDPRGALDAADAQGRLTWLGHASVLATVDGVTVLVDPVFGRAGPVPRKAPTPLSPDELPHVDVVAVTHGHYDHLDRASLAALGKRFGEDTLFVTPRGLSGTLPKACRRRMELTWWQGVTVGGVDVVLVPAQHWHRRGLLDVNRALWGGFVVRGGRTVYHSGDTGHFGGFEAIGLAFPSLDTAVLPIGAWEPRWFMGDQHMDPDGSVAAFQALGAQRFVAMHWNTFDLTDEPLDEGPRELRMAAERAAITFDSRFVVPAHGETVAL